MKADEFVSSIKEIVRYWSTLNISEYEKCDGVAFGILNFLDGYSAEAQPFAVCPIDKKGNPGKDIANHLHELYAKIPDSKLIQSVDSEEKRYILETFEKLNKELNDLRSKDPAVKAGFGLMGQGASINHALTAMVVALAKQKDEIREQYINHLNRCTNTPTDRWPGVETCRQIIPW